MNIIGPVGPWMTKTAIKRTISKGLQANGRGRGYVKEFTYDEDRDRVDLDELAHLISQGKAEIVLVHCYAIDPRNGECWGNYDDSIIINVWLADEEPEVTS
jgi:hypothetical protein